MNDAKEYFKDFLQKVEQVPQSPYSLLVYVGTVLFLSLPLFMLNLFANMCFFNVIVVALAVIIPYKFYKEEDIKKLAVAGLISVLLVSVVGTVYHVNDLYTQETQYLESEDHLLYNGTVNELYGDTETEFNFTVTVSEDLSPSNYTVYLNMSYLGANNSFSDPLIDSYKMESLNQSGEGNRYYKVMTVEERLYEHYFSLEIDENGNKTWEETDEGYGPLTIPKNNAYLVIFLPRAVSPILLYALAISLIWWRKKMKNSKRYSTDGLEEKEESLEDYCDNCGTLLSGEEECPECGEPISYEDEKKDLEKIEETTDDMELS